MQTYDDFTQNISGTVEQSMDAMRKFRDKCMELNTNLIRMKALQKEMFDFFSIFLKI